MPLSITWAIVGVLCLATFIRSALGFGEALFSVPLLALMMPVEVAAPIAVLMSITVAAIVVAEDWRVIHFHSAARLVAATVVGTPIGLWLLIRLPETAVKGLLAVCILGFSTHALASRRTRTFSRGWLTWLSGFVAGILGGAYGMNGPPLVLYGTLRGWAPVEFRATLQGYFLPASVLVMTGYWLSGLWVRAVTRYYLIALPGVLLAIALGRFVNRRLETRTFHVCAHAALVGIAIVLLVQTF
jgi:uncharacterized membrane protein YfcA